MGFESDSQLGYYKRTAGLISNKITRIKIEAQGNVIIELKSDRKRLKGGRNVSEEPKAVNEICKDATK